MGRYINKGNEGFRRIRNSEYVDKSELIAMVNGTLFTEHCFTCVSRCRRFGKSMAAKMLAAYYDHSCESRELFADLEIAKDPSFEQHLNKYPVIYLDMTSFVTRYKDESIIAHIEEDLKEEVREAYPQVVFREKDDLMGDFIRIVASTGDRFFFIIDEWDAVCREFAPATKPMDEYVNWLRRMFKDASAIDAFAGVYMTGILPIKKYKTQSAMNNFEEYSIIEPGDMSSFFGFTKAEVVALADKYSADYDELAKWYDGYRIGDQPSMFNPNSVMSALRRRRCVNYWNKTATYEAIVPYIKMNYEGLKDDIVSMLAGGKCLVNTLSFQNDLTEVNSRDDVLTVLIHLGYLSYDGDAGICFIPNKEVADEMENAVKAAKWQYVTQALEQSRQLLADTLAGNSEAVAHAIEAVHDENTSILSYNNENSLACVISLAYYYAKNDYIVHREYASGKGFADLVLIPRKNVESPAIIVELKYSDSVDSAINQIKQKNYPSKVAQYAHDLLLVGINYDKEQKKHTCIIERYC